MKIEVEETVPIIDNEIERKKYEWLNENSNYGSPFWGKPYVKLISELALYSRNDGININRLLDLGTGRGNFCKAISEYYIKVYGLDWCIIPNKDCYNDNVEYIRSDAQSIPLSDNSVDVTTSFDFFEHIIPDNVGNVIEESVRVTTSFIFHHIMLNRSSIGNREKLKELFGDGELHQTRKDRKWWKDKFENYGKVLVLDIPPYHSCFLIILENVELFTPNILTSFRDNGWY